MRGTRLRSVSGMLPAALIVLPPLLWVALAALRAPALPGPLLDRTARGLLLQSLLIAAAATAAALLLGVPFGWFTARYRLPGRRLLMAASLLPLLLPPYCAAHAWFAMLAREGPVNSFLLRLGVISAPVSTDRAGWLAALLLAFGYWPIIAWFTLFAAWSVPREQEDAARLQLSDAAAARWTAWPALARALPAAGLLVFLLALADFGIPFGLGLSSYPVEIVNRFQEALDPGTVARMALPLLLIVVPLVLWQLRLLERSPVGPSEPADPRLLPSALGRWGGAGWCALALLVSAGISLGELAVESLPLRTYATVWAATTDHFLNTLITAGGGALLAVALALAYGWSARGRRVAGLDLALTLPYALPASLIGVAMIQIMNRTGPLGDLYTSLGGLVWLYAALFFPFAHKSIQPGWGHLDAALLDEGAVLGAGAWTQFRTTAWPVLKPYAAAGAAIVLLLGSREIEATGLLRIPDGETVAFRIQDYLHYAPGPNVAALSILLVLLSALLVGAVALWAARASG